jgi:hypothetical protein
MKKITNLAKIKITNYKFVIFYFKNEGRKNLIAVEI